MLKPQNCRTEVLKDEWADSRVNAFTMRLVARVNSNCEGLMESIATVKGMRL